MTRQLSCDQHVLYRAGCEECQHRGRNYEQRRMILLNQGVRLSVAVDLTASRIRELRAAGYSLPYLAAETGLGTATLTRICNKTVGWVQLRVYRAVERAYERHRDIPGGNVRVVTKARKRGWEPPVLPMPEEVGEEIIDPEAVRRAASGDRTVTLTQAERAEAIRTLEKRRLSAREIAEILGVTDRTVQRWRGGVTKRPGVRGRPKQQTA